jgi:glycosyltransferase involved in cell wall biosynthesis
VVIHSEAGRNELTESDENLLDTVVVVVAFNEAEKIGDCLDALLHQETDQRYEVLVVDDGSSDETARVVEQMQPLDPRLKLIRHDVNRGRGAARRTGQDAVLARHIAFVDADIIIPPDWLQRCSDALQDFSAVSAVPIPDGDSAVVWRIFGATVRPRVGFSGITGNNVIFDAEVLRRNPFDAKYSLGEDFRLSHRLLRSGFRLSVLADLSVEHRESKTYAKTIQYMWETGVDAASHPFEFHIVRLADVSWAVWLIWSLASLFAAGLEWWSWPLGIVSVLAITAFTTLLYTFSRFRVWPRPLRWLGSAAGNLPLLIAYLFGRTWGLAGLSSARRRRALGW